MGLGFDWVFRRRTVEPRRTDEWSRPRSPTTGAPSPGATGATVVGQGRPQMRLYATVRSEEEDEGGRPQIRRSRLATGRGRTPPMYLVLFGLTT